MGIAASQLDIPLFTVKQIIRVGIAASQLDIPLFTPLFVAGCGQPQPGIAHYSTSVVLQQIFVNLPHKQC